MQFLEILSYPECVGSFGKLLWPFSADFEHVSVDLIKHTRASFCVLLATLRTYCLCDKRGK